MTIFKKSNQRNYSKQLHLGNYYLKRNLEGKNEKLEENGKRVYILDKLNKYCVCPIKLLFILEKVSKKVDVIDLSWLDINKPSEIVTPEKCYSED